MGHRQVVGLRKAAEKWPKTRLRPTGYDPLRAGARARRPAACVKPLYMSRFTRTLGPVAKGTQPRRAAFDAAFGRRAQKLGPGAGAAPAFAQTALFLSKQTQDYFVKNV